MLKGKILGKDGEKMVRGKDKDISSVGLHISALPGVQIRTCELEVKREISPIVVTEACIPDEVISEEVLAAAHREVAAQALKGKGRPMIVVARRG